MQPPGYLIKKGVTALPCIGDGRQSGTSGSPSILNASPEAAAGGGLALLKTGDRVRIDLNKGTADILISDEELDERRADAAEATAATTIPTSQTPWQEIQRGMVDQLVRRHGAEAGGEIPARRPDQAACRATTTDGHRPMPSASPTSAAPFAQLHETGCFVIPNPWDVGTRALSAASRLQGAGHDQLRLRLRAGLPDRRRRAARR